MPRAVGKITSHQQVDGPYARPKNNSSPNRLVNLRHLPEYRVLLCATCSHCVLLGALDRHLKDIHGVPRADRKVYIDEAQALDLAELDEVQYPEATQPPIRGLPVLDGYACTVEGCSHTCSTFKRMQAHWRADHPELYRAKGAKGYSRRVKLQTFFRGNCLRYFIVAEGLSDSSSDSALSLPRATPTIDKNKSSTEWLLIKHFNAEAFPSMLPTKSTKKSWRDMVLQVGDDAEYLRYALLCVTAHHIAYENPESRFFYGCEASKYRALAIEALPKRVTTIDKSNFWAVFNFSRLMTVCCLAGVQLNNLRGDEQLTTDMSVLPEWVPIQLQGRSLVWPHRGEGRIANALHGDPPALFKVETTMENKKPEAHIPYNPYDGRLEKLNFKIKAIADQEPNSICLQALHTLRQAWTMPFQSEAVSFRDVSLMFIVRAPVKYLDLVKDEDPVALVIFAHYCVMFSLSEEHYWYMRHHAERLLLRVIGSLEPEWHSWISWPISMVFGPEPVQSLTPPSESLDFSGFG